MKNENTPVRLIHTSDPLYQQVLDLRHRILRLPIGLTLSAADTAGEDRQHIMVYLSQDRVSGCVLLQAQDAGRVKMRQLAVDHHLQGMGIGRQLVQFAEDFARAQQATDMMLHARKSALPFYLKLGYAAYGDTFNEVGIPHRSMKKELRLL